MLSSVLTYLLLHAWLCWGAPSVLGGRPSAFDVRSEKRAPHVDPFNNLVVFDPPSDYIVPRTLYARTMLHSDQQTIYATWENYSPEGGNNPLVYFPIYKSTDLGKTWEHISNVTDQVMGWGLRYQPFLYELREDIGDYEAGTILLSGSAIPTNLSNTQIELYASRDQGYTCEFVSHIAAGGVAKPNNGETPVWEPFLLTWNHQLVVYYSDQRDPAHGQKIVHQVSSDLVNWGDVVDDVAYDVYDDRPGMPIIAALPNGQFIYTYEWYGAPEGGFAVYYKLSDDPDNTHPTGSPTVTWTPYPEGSNGTIVVSGSNYKGVFLNTQLGAPGSNWEYRDTASPNQYTRFVMAMPEAGQIMIAGGGVLNGENNDVSVSVIQL
ncbi:glycoside hydrolase family 93 protein [Schizophyllum commune]